MRFCHTRVGFDCYFRSVGDVRGIKYLSDVLIEQYRRSSAEIDGVVMQVVPADISYHRVGVCFRFFAAEPDGIEVTVRALRQAERDAFKEKGLTIVLDEVQDIPFGEGTAFNNLLRIARKKNVSLLMATAVSPLEKKCAPAVARQYCAVSAYFKLADSECRTLARDIDYQHWPKLNSTMHELVKGEFIATGDFVGENDEPERSPQTLCNSEEGEETICITESKSAS